MNPILAGTEAGHYRLMVRAGVSAGPLILLNLLTKWYYTPVSCLLETGCLNFSSLSGLGRMQTCRVKGTTEGDVWFAA
jgi:hypothetical protein